MDKLSGRELETIESRLDSFGEWFESVVLEGGSYDIDTARADFQAIAGDMRRLIEQARARGGKE